MTDKFDLLDSVWKTSVADEYKRGRVTTERTLQAVLFEQIRKARPDVRVYVEPCFPLSAERSIRPDLVICEGEKISLVAEIKFAPHWYPEFKRDISKLSKLSKLSTESLEHGYEIAINPDSGKYSGERDFLSRSTRFAFVVIAQHDSQATDQVSVREAAIANGIHGRLALYYGRIGKDQIDFGSEEIA
jgi:hypothetical protein